MRKSYKHPLMAGITYFKDDKGRFYYYKCSNIWFVKDEKKYSGLFKGFVKNHYQYL